MNMKIARVNVHWKGKDQTLSEINDPIIQKRLKAILDAHQLLWGIWIIATKDIAENTERSELLRRSFETRFLANDNGVSAGASTHSSIDQARLRHYEDVLEFWVDQYANSDEKRIAYDNGKQRIRDEAQDLVEIARDPVKDLDKRLRRALRNLAIKPGTAPSSKRSVDGR